MNKIQIFNNSEFGEVRTLVVDNEPWFVGKDVATILGYAKPLNALATHIDEDDSLKQGLIDSMGRTQETILINESGLYSLILSSKLPDAKQFKRWVTHEVLPTIRKTGQYQVAGYQPKATSVGEIVNLINMTRQTMKDQGCDPREIAIAVKQICDQFNIQLPDSFIKPNETKLQDVMDMIDYIYSQPTGKGHKPTYEEFIITQTSVRRLRERNNMSD